MKNTKKTNNDRTRNFACMVYEESAPSNWKSILDSHHVPCLISPLHDSDVNDDGTPKKPHYHVMILFDGVKSPKQAREVFETINGVGTEIIKSPKGYAEYLTHKNNKDKAQYNISDIVSLNGADYDEITEGGRIKKSEKYIIIKEIIIYCRENGIVSFDDLVWYSIYNNELWFKVLVDDGCFLIREFVRSQYIKLKELNK